MDLERPYSIFPDAVQTEICVSGGINQGSNVILARRHITPSRFVWRIFTKEMNEYVGRHSCDNVMCYVGLCALLYSAAIFCNGWEQIFYTNCFNYQIRKLNRLPLVVVISWNKFIHAMFTSFQAVYLVYSYGTKRTISIGESNVMAESWDYV